jgi:2-polyprenyl-6-methoxyphenol hydroxylase-like FAD-dependent oxidoreductase
MQVYYDCRVHAQPDVVVVGAGIAGSATALACAALGSDVLLLEARPSTMRRVAGELVHPRGARLLKDLGVSFPHALPVRGFTMHPAGGGAPARFDYGQPLMGFTAEYSHILDQIRRQIAATRHITFVQDARVFELSRSHVRFYAEGGQRLLWCDRVVNAGGHTAPNSQPFPAKHRLSRMLAVTIESNALNDERGHVFMGAPGPIVAYRVTDELIRAFLDVPIGYRGDLVMDYGSRFPRPMQFAFDDSIAASRTTWSANFSQPRLTYQSEGVARVGDATGVLHPLTACGITLALEDASAYASSVTTAAYVRRRRRATRTTEMLTGALYELARNDDGRDDLILDGLYTMAHRNVRRASATTRSMAAEDTRITPFILTFASLIARALPAMLRSRDARGFLRALQWAAWMITPRRRRPVAPSR